MYIHGASTVESPKKDLGHNAKPLHKGQDFMPQTVLSMQFKPLKKENLSTKDNNDKNQTVLCLEVPL